MDKSNFMTFNQFWDEIKPQKIIVDQRSTDEIMTEVLQIEKCFDKGGNEHGAI